MDYCATKSNLVVSVVGVDMMKEHFPVDDEEKRHDMMMMITMTMPTPRKESRLSSQPKRSFWKPVGLCLPFRLLCLFSCLLSQSAAADTLHGIWYWTESISLPPRISLHCRVRFIFFKYVPVIFVWIWIYLWFECFQISPFLRLICSCRRTSKRPPLQQRKSGP